MISFMILELIKDRNVVAEEIPDANTPDNTIMPSIDGIIFIEAQISA